MLICTYHKSWRIFALVGRLNETASFNIPIKDSRNLGFYLRKKFTYS